MSATGKIIIEIRDGKLTVYPVADSDIENAALLNALRELIVNGDLMEATQRPERGR